MRAALCTLGCKVNQYDSEAMAELLRAAGYETVPFGEKADVYIINTCTVTNMADKKSRQAISRAKKLNPNAVICVCGCMAQKNAAAALAIEGVSCVVGTAGRANIVSVIDNAKFGRVSALSESGEYEPLFVSSPGEKTRGYIKIEEGCDNFCSYCIIPYVRGRVRSRDMESILAEARELSKTAAEVVLTGINISAYGRDTGGSLAQIAEETAKIEGIKRIRFGSVEQGIITEDFLRRISGIEKVCPHFHLSLQSGSGGVLSRMNRKYTPEEFEKSVALIRKYYDEPAITTDIITGFPAETEEEFSETVEFVKRVGFSRLHVFPYSEREGTVAAKMTGQVPVSVRRERANRLIAVGKALEESYISRFLGKTQGVLFEQERENGLCEGHTARYLTVEAKAKPGELINVLLKEQKSGIIIAERTE